jgi:hypothetical protein
MDNDDELSAYLSEHEDDVSADDIFRDRLKERYKITKFKTTQEEKNVIREWVVFDNQHKKHYLYN